MKRTSKREEGKEDAQKHEEVKKTQRKKNEGEK
jgi:hypothetical protein